MNTEWQEIRRLYSDINNNSMKFTCVPRVFINSNKSTKIEPGISVIKVKQPDRLLMWARFQIFKILHHKKHKELIKKVEMIRIAQLSALGIDSIK